MRSPRPASPSRSRRRACARPPASCIRRQDLLRALHRRGVPITLGSDGHVPGGSRAATTPRARGRARLRLPDGLDVQRPRAPRGAAWLSSASARPSTRTGWSPGLPLVLGGVKIPHSHGLEGHSDADIVCHALCDALLGAACLDDIGTMFPSSDERWARCAQPRSARRGLAPHRGHGLERRQRRRVRRAAGAEDRALPRRHARARRRRPALRRRARVGARRPAPTASASRAAARARPARPSRCSTPLEPSVPAPQASARRRRITTTPSASMVASAITPSTWMAARLSPP